MRPEQLLYATSSDDNTSVLLGTKIDNHMIFLGSSVPMSAKAGDNGTSCTLFPTKGKGGIVAVAVRHFSGGSGKHSRCNWTPYFLKVRWGEKGPLIDLNYEMVLQSRGQAYDHHVEIQIGDERFSSYDSKHDSCHFVSDANLLVRFLAGDVSPDEVRDAADENIAEVLARKQLSVVEAEFADMRERRDEYIMIYDDKVDELREVSGQLATAKATLGELLVLAERSGPWCYRTSVQGPIDELTKKGIVIRSITQ